MPRDDHRPNFDEMKDFWESYDEDLRVYRQRKAQREKIEGMVPAVVLILCALATTILICVLLVVYVRPSEAAAWPAACDGLTVAAECMARMQEGRL